MLPDLLRLLLVCIPDFVSLFGGGTLLQATPANFELVPFIESVYQSMIGQTGSITSSIEGKIRGAAGIGALLYIFSRVIGQISRNESIDFFPLLRPFALMMLIALVPRLCNAMDTLGSQLLQVGIGQQNSINQKVKEHFEAISQAQQKKLDATDESTDTGLLDSIKDTATAIANGFSELPQKLFTWFLYLIQLILQAVFFLCYSLMYLFSVAYRIILRLGAPIAFVLAIFPGFTGNLVNWFAKYLNFVLLPFVSAMYGTLSFSVLNAFMTQYDPTSVVTTEAELSQIALMGIAYIGVLIMCIIGYFQVPSMTEMLLSVGGVGALAQGAQNAAKQSAATTKTGVKAAAAPFQVATAGATAVVGASMRSFGGGGAGPAATNGAGGYANYGGANRPGQTGQGQTGPGTANRVDGGGTGMHQTPNGFSGAATGKAMNGVAISGTATRANGSSGPAGSSNSDNGIPAPAANSGGLSSAFNASEADPYERVGPPDKSGQRSSTIPPAVTQGGGSTTQNAASAEQDDPYGRGVVPADAPIAGGPPPAVESAPEAASMETEPAGNRGTIQRNIPAAYQKGQQVGARIAGYLGGSVAGTYAFLAGGNGVDQGVRQSYSRGEQRVGRVGSVIGGAVFGAGMALGEVGRFGYNVLGGTVSNYQALNSTDPFSGKRRDMPMRYRTMVDRNRQSNQNT